MVHLAVVLVDSRSEGFSELALLVTKSSNLLTVRISSECDIQILQEGITSG